MNLAKSTLSVALSPQPSTYSIYKRIANLLLAVIAVAICTNLWLLSSEQAQNWHDKQANQLGRSLTQQGARGIALAVMNKDEAQIEFQLQSLIQDPHVDSAAVFNHRGQMIESTEGDLSLLTNYRMRDNMPLVFVEEVAHEAQIQGYLRLLLKEEQVMQYHSEYQRQILEQILVLMMLAGAAGILIARVFYKFRYRHAIRAAQVQKSA
jgi:membrane protein